MDETAINGDNRDKKGRFGANNNANPNGRPKKPEIEALRKAIKAAEKGKDKTLLQHFVETAYEDKTVLVALMRKLLPDLRSADVNLAAEDGSIVFRVLLDGNKSGFSGQPKAEGGLEVLNAGKQR